MTLANPALAVDVDLKKLKFPTILEPKIDGMRGLVSDGVLWARSLKPIVNLFCQKRMAGPDLNGLDGELAYGPPNTVDLCPNTMSAVTSLEGEPMVDHWVFDLHDQPANTPYKERLIRLRERVLTLQGSGHKHLQMIPFNLVHSMDELLEQEAYWLAGGWEGIVMRDPEAPLQSGRSSVYTGGYLRLKRFTDSEFLITKLIEGQVNNNPAVKNELGHTKRSTHKANMAPSGMVGAMEGIDCKTGEEVRVSPGRMTKAECIFYWNNPDKILQRIGKYQFFGRVKNAPRFATFQSFRDPIDMS
jgi:DNA ligase-1